MRTAEPTTPARAGRLIEVTGVVQGVGYRPFVWRLARRYGLTGWVLSRGAVVEIVAEGGEDDLERFCRGLRAEAPLLAQVDDVRCWPREPAGLTGFDVGPSIELDEELDRLVSPDAAPCEECLRELFDPADRRYRYPFISCAECGPRFTIIEALPYDRARTSMRAFPPCDACRAEHDDPQGRRFHAEPVACASCGPALELRDGGWRPIGGDPIDGAASLLRAGSIVAVKGPGGFHLACDATNEAAVAELRRRKGQPDKPFAVMVASPEEADERFDLSPSDRALLSSWRAPIVLVRDRGSLAASVAPGFHRSGAMLPAAALHHLLIRAAGTPLAMTSGNRADEPACIANDQARRRLRHIADAYLLHDAEIVARYDDAVTHVRGHQPIVTRRARGYAPAPITLPADVRPTLGTGAERHGAFCLASGRRGFLSAHIGDLDSDQAMASYAASLERLRALFGIEPELVAHDLDPDLSTSELARSLGIPAFAVQHHHAHVVAVMAEHQLEGPVIGVAFDGFGLGEDGSGWGSEFLIGDWKAMRRAGHLRAVAQPGGAAAVHHPVRMALSHAADAGVLTPALRLLGKTRSDVKGILAQLETGEDAALTSSAGRLFDAVAALTGVCQRSTFEGQPAILLEQVADESATFEYPFDVSIEPSGVVLDTRPITEAVVKDLVRGRSAGDVAGRFHRTLTAAVVTVCRMLRGESGLGRVCLAGGVFANDLLTTDLAARLAACDFEVFTAQEVPVGDGGIALGQVLVAHARAADGAVEGG